MRVFITGYGLSKISRWFGETLEDLAFKSVKDIENKGGELREIDALIVANSFGGILQSQNLLSSLIAEDIGFSGKLTMTVENGGASGASAILTASSLVKSGLAKNVLVIGVEKMSDYIGSVFNHSISTFMNAEHEAFYGSTLASGFAILARSYLSKYKYSEEDLGAWPILMHENALDVPHAQLKFKITEEQVNSSDIVSSPLRVLHSPPVSDGSAAVIVSAEDSSIPKEKRLAEIKFGYLSSQLMELSLRENLEEFYALKCVKDALEKGSSIDIKKVDLIEISDDYTISAPIIIEGLGLSDKGSGLRSILDGRYRLGDKPSINVTGGTKSRGHPFGATGVYQVAEVTSLLSDGKVKGARVNGELGLVVSMGGIGIVLSGILLEKV
jgi:acetyl-CoA C-acetyltransferase/acetyl-CoA acyltransferase